MDKRMKKTTKDWMDKHMKCEKCTETLDKKASYVLSGHGQTWIVCALCAWQFSNLFQVTKVATV